MKKKNTKENRKTIIGEFGRKQLMARKQKIEEIERKIAQTMARYIASKKN